MVKAEHFVKAAHTLPPATAVVQPDQRRLIMLRVPSLQASGGKQLSVYIGLGLLTTAYLVVTNILMLSIPVFTISTRDCHGTLRLSPVVLMDCLLCAS